MHWFTADPHYSHGNIIRFCDRPFPDVATMNAHLLAECRARVQPDDDLWILGDFTAGRSTDARRREVRTIYHALPGRKHLIRGNHDEDWVCDLPWASVAETADIVVDKRRLFLCHYPMITWPGARHQGLQLFGHVHQNWCGSRNSVNVGVDVWNFQPMTLPEILQRVAKLPVNAHWDQVEPGGAWPTELCAGCGRILDPALVSGQAVVRNGRIVVAATNEKHRYGGERPWARLASSAWIWPRTCFRVCAVCAPLISGLRCGVLCRAEACLRISRDWGIDFTRYGQKLVTPDQAAA